MPRVVLLVESSTLLAERLLPAAAGWPDTEAVLARNLDEALALVGLRRPAALLVNVDGLRWPALPEVAALRAAAPTARLVALTAQYDPETVRACLARGATAVVDLHGDLAALASSAGCRPRRPDQATPVSGTLPTRLPRDAYFTFRRSPDGRAPRGG